MCSRPNKFLKGMLSFDCNGEYMGHTKLYQQLRACAAFSSRVLIGCRPWTLMVLLSLSRFQVVVQAWLMGQQGAQLHNIGRQFLNKKRQKK
jgi:hypothetical protein